MAETGFLPISELKGLADEDLLLPYQQRWVSLPNRYNWCVKSRRIGLSWADASHAALTAASDRAAGGMNCFYMSYDKDMTRQYISDAAAWAKLFNIVCSEIVEGQEIWRDGDEDKSCLTYRIHFNSGFRVEALSSTARSLRSKQGWILVDECSHLDNFKEIIKAGRAMSIWPRGGMSWISTYYGTDEPFYELGQDLLKGKYPTYSRSQITFREAIADGLYKRMCLIDGVPWTPDLELEYIDRTYSEYGEDAAEELDCIPNNSSGKYFPRALLERAMQDCTAPILQFHCKPEFTVLPAAERERLTDEWLRNAIAPHLERLQPFLPTAYGQDFARETLSCILIGQQQRNLRITSELGLELRGVPYEQQRQVAFWLFDHLPRLVGVAIDSTGNGGYLGEVAMQKLGSRALPVKLNAPWYAENFPRYKADLESDYFTLPASVDWIDDHRLIESVKGQPTVPNKNTLGTDGKPRHGDSAIAAVLLKFAFLNQGGPLEFNPLPDPPPSRRATFEQRIDWGSFLDR